MSRQPAEEAEEDVEEGSRARLLGGVEGVVAGLGGVEGVVAGLGGGGDTAEGITKEMDEEIMKRKERQVQKNCCKIILKKYFVHRNI